MSQHLTPTQKDITTSGLYTLFMDMHSGGGCKLGAEHIYIEAKEDDAIPLFEKIFDRDPENVSCQCCGEDYSISEERDPNIENGSYVVTKNDIINLTN